MSTLYDAAVQNYDAAAEVLAALGAQRLDLLADLTARQGGAAPRPLAGYRDLTGDLGLCLPTGISGSLENAGPTRTAVTTRARAEWMSLEVASDALMTAGTCYLEAKFRGGMDRGELVADVFLRETTGDRVQDGPLQEWRFTPGSIALLPLQLPEAPEGMTRRLIVQLRHPPQRLELHRFAVMVI